MKRHVSDNRVLHHWKGRGKDSKIVVRPSFYSEAGIPISRDGEDLEFVGTTIEDPLFEELLEMLKDLREACLETKSLEVEGILLGDVCSDLLDQAERERAV
jgi:hypothetical protein